MARRTIACLLAAGALAAPAAASTAPPAFAHPKAYASRSGASVLDVDPSHRHGRGPARYELSRDGRVLWSGERPYTLLDAVVADDGTVVGYAYDSGYEDFGDPGALHLVVLDPSGRPRVHETAARRDSPYLHGGFEPRVCGLVVDPGGDRVVFRVSSLNDRETWRPFRVSTGAAGQPLSPEDALSTKDRTVSLRDARALPGTPLTLVDAWFSDEKTHASGTTLALLGPDATVAWRLDLPKDREARPGDRAAAARMDALRWSSALLDTSRPREFTVLFARTGERVTFAVEPAAAGWTVRETARAPWSPEPAPPPVTLPPAPERSLRALAQVALGDAASSRDAETRGIHQFDVDDRGRVGFVREQDGGAALVFGSAGSFTAIPLGRLDADSGWPLVAWTGRSRWLVARQHATGPAGYWVDVDDSTVRPFVMPDGLKLRAIAGRPAEGGAVLLSARESGTIVVSRETTVSWIDGAGRVERTADVESAEDQRFYGADDVAVTRRGEVVLVGPVGGGVFVVGARGAVARRIDLKTAWGREPGYASGVSADEDGGFVVADAGATFVRMRADGSVRATLRPRYADGRPTGRLFRVRLAPDGALWGADGEALLRFDDDGIAQAVAGTASGAGPLGEVAGAAVDASDRVHLVDRRTGSVHVFGPDGTPSHVCRPDPGDVEDAIDGRASVTVAGDGRVWVGLPGLGDRLLECTAAGARVAPREWNGLERVWNPATGGFWETRSGELVLLDEKGVAQRTVARRLDRKWLDDPSEAAVGVDGSIAVADTLDLGLWQKESTIGTYAPDGTPIGLVRLPEAYGWGSLAFDGRTLAFWDADEVRLFDREGLATGRFRPRIDGQQPRGWPLFVAAGGRELWMLDAARRTMHRYALD